MFQHFPFQAPPKLTQIGIFGLKKSILATQDWTDQRLIYDYVDNGSPVYPLQRLKPQAKFKHQMNLC
jgi:hypothetical protein